MTCASAPSAPVFGTSGAPQTDVGTAVAASCAVPGYFAPVLIGGGAYVDGGGHFPTNADVLLADDLDLVVVLSPMTATRTAVRADAALRLAARRYVGSEARRLRRGGATVVLLQPSPSDLAVMGVNPMRAGRVADIIHTAVSSVRRRLDAQPTLVDVLSGR